MKAVANQFLAAALSHNHRLEIHNYLRKVLPMVTGT
jgi:hypothetical protein